METPNTPVLKRVFEQLKEDRKVTTQADFARQTGYHATPMSMMVNGEKPIPYNLLERLYVKFGVNINYVISGGEGPFYVKELNTMTLHESEVQYGFRAKFEQLEKENEMLRGQLADKDKIIKLLEKTAG